MSFLHIFPESEAVFAFHSKNKWLWDIGPFPGISILGVLLGILWVERIGFSHDHGLNHDEDNGATGHQHADHEKGKKGQLHKGGEEVRDPVFKHKGQELDLSEHEIDDDLEEYFKK